MNMSNAETFCDIISQVSQDSDLHSLLKMNTRELLPAPNNEQLDLDVLSLYVADENDLKYDIKSFPVIMDHINKVPELGILSVEPYNFNVGIQDQDCKSPSWCYAAKLEKLYVKKKTSFTVFVSYNNPQPGACLYLRIMMVCSASQDIHRTIYRCQHDMSKDNGQAENWKKEHVVRCLNPEADYIGKADGVAFKDRLAMMIALQGVVQQQVTPVSLEFLCQNSCPTIERRATALVFTLENEYGRILGRKSIHVKICSCPKRDMDKEVNKVATGATSATKRKLNDDKNSSSNVEQEPPRKLTRQSSVNGSRPARPVSSAVQRDSPVPSTSTVSIDYIKKETPYVSLTRSSSAISNNTVENDNTAIVLNLRLPDIATAVEVVEYAFKHISADMVRCDDGEKHKRLAKYLAHCRRMKKHSVCMLVTELGTGLDENPSLRSFNQHILSVFLYKLASRDIL